MAEEMKCAQCSYPIENGEVVAVDISEGGYHFINDNGELSSRPVDCFMKAVLDSKSAISSRPGVFYKGKIYDLSQLKALPNASELKLERVRDTKKCSKVFGNLEGLANVKPFFPA